MNKEEFDLSEKIDFEEVDRGIAGKFSRASILVSDVKEFIKLLKDKIEHMSVDDSMDYYDNCNYADFEREIDKLAGKN